MFKKNTAVTGFGIGHFINATTGEAVTTGTPTCKRTLDGTGGACANAAAYNSAGAVWEIDLAAGDMNADCVILSFTLTDCLPISYTIKTVTAVPDASGYMPVDIYRIEGSELEDASEIAANVTKIGGVAVNPDTAQLIDRIAVIAIGDISQAGTDTELFDYGGIRATVSASVAGNRTIVWGTTP